MIKSRWVLLLTGMAFSLLSAEPSAPFVTEVSPLQEGSYVAHITCRDADLPELCRLVEGDHPMVAMNTFSYAGAVVSIGNVEVNLPKYSFNFGTLRNEGRVLDARGVFPQTAELAIQVQFNRKDGTFEGWIRDPRFPSDLYINGWQVTSAKGLYDKGSAPALSTGEVVGTYEDAAMGIRLNIKPALNDPSREFLATALLPTGQYLNFPVVKVDREARLLSLVFPQPNRGTALKWLLRFEDREDPQVISGISLKGLNGSASGLSFARR